MKRTISILLLALFLFNLGGYYIIFLGLKIRADRALTEQLDREAYDEEETVTLKIPIAIPYKLSEAHFKRVDGNFVSQGKHYKLVKQKLQHDTLFVICIPNPEAQRLEHAMLNYGSKANDLPTGESPAFSFLTKLIKDFCSQEDIRQRIECRGWFSRIAYAEKFSPLPIGCTDITLPPPKV